MSKLIKIIDDIVPLVDYVNDVIKEKTPKLVKNKINKRNRLLKSFKKRPNIELKKRIADLNCEIRSHFLEKQNLKFASRLTLIRFIVKNFYCVD